MLLAYHPSNGSTIALMDKLWFGNGVALSPKEDYVLVADSIQMKIHRCSGCSCMWYVWLLWNDTQLRLMVLVADSIQTKIHRCR